MVMVWETAGDRNALNIASALRNLNNFIFLYLLAEQHSLIVYTHMYDQRYL